MAFRIFKIRKLTRCFRPAEATMHLNALFADDLGEEGRREAHELVCQYQREHAEAVRREILALPSPPRPRRCPG